MHLKWTFPEENWKMCLCDECKRHPPARKTRTRRVCKVRAILIEFYSKKFSINGVSLPFITFDIHPYKIQRNAKEPNQTRRSE